MFKKTTNLWIFLSRASAEKFHRGASGKIKTEKLHH